MTTRYGAHRNPVGSYRGLRNPKRERCQHCGKLGLGPMKAMGLGVFQKCRYCNTLTRVEVK